MCGVALHGRGMVSSETWLSVVFSGVGRPRYLRFYAQKKKVTISGWCGTAATQTLGPWRGRTCTICPSPNWFLGRSRDARTFLKFCELPNWLRDLVYLPPARDQAPETCLCGAGSLGRGRLGVTEEKKGVTFRRALDAPASTGVR